jgi:hypothetical protein
MCTYSMVADEWGRTIPEQHPWVQPDGFAPRFNWDFTSPSKAEFDALKADVERMKKELEAARQQDIEEDQPDCEKEPEAVAFIKQVADYVGVDITVHGLKTDDE